MAFHWLDQATLHAVWKAAIDLGLSRDAVLPRSVAAMMPTSSKPGDQLLLDLQYLNDIEGLADGSVPLRAWLETAVLLHGHRREARAFQDAIKKLSGGDEGKAEATAARPPEPPNRPERLWTVTSIEVLWQHPDSQKLVEVMKHYPSVRHLRNMAQQAGFDASRVDWQQPLDLAARELVEKSFRSNQLEAVLRQMHTDVDLARWHDTLRTILDR